MVALALNNIDIAEDHLLKKGSLLDILLNDKTSGKNIIWATESYENRGAAYSSKAYIQPELITGQFGLLIQPRASKSKSERLQRTKGKAEVFTPLTLVKKMNDLADGSFKPNKNNWQDYVKENRLEITCGEAPFIASRYDPISSSSKTIPLKDRVGFLDRKIKLVSKYCSNKEDWLHWVKIAYQSSYGYEWQGDNLLIARENILYTLIDYHSEKFNDEPSLKILEEFSEIISWNIFQMDGLKYVIPMSCSEGNTFPHSTQLSLFEDKRDLNTKVECEGCTQNIAKRHSGQYVKIMDWIEKKQIYFHELINSY